MDVANVSIIMMVYFTFVVIFLNTSMITDAMMRVAAHDVIVTNSHMRIAAHYITVPGESQITLICSNVLCHTKTGQVIHYWILSFC